MENLEEKSKEELIKLLKDKTNECNLWYSRYNDVAKQLESVKKLLNGFVGLLNKNN